MLSKLRWKLHRIVKGKLFCLHVFVGICLAIIMSYIHLLSPWISSHSVLLSLVLFNFMFAFLSFPLKGALWRKICLLLFGNIVGVAWGLIFSAFAVTLTLYLGEGFKMIYELAGPLINSIWIVSLWSFGLSMTVSCEAS